MPKESPTPHPYRRGRHDYTTRSEIAERWLSRLQAPKKTLVWFAHSAHVIPVEEPGRTLVTLVQEVLPLARVGEPTT